MHVQLKDLETFQNSLCTCAMVLGGMPNDRRVHVLAPTINRKLSWLLVLCFSFILNFIVDYHFVSPYTLATANMPKTLKSLDRLDQRVQARAKLWRVAKHTVAAPGRLVRNSLSHFALERSMNSDVLAPAETWVRKGAIDRLVARTRGIVDSFPEEDQTAVFRRDAKGNPSFKCCKLNSWRGSLFTEQFFHMEHELLGDEHTRQLYSAIKNKHEGRQLIPERSLFKSDKQKFAYTYHLAEKLMEKSLESFVDSQCGIMKDTNLMMSWNVGFWMNRDKHWFLEDLNQQYQARYRNAMSRTETSLENVMQGPMRLSRCFDSTVTTPHKSRGFNYEKAPLIDAKFSSLQETQAAMNSPNATRMRNFAIARWLAPISFDQGEARYGSDPKGFADLDKKYYTTPDEENMESYHAFFKIQNRGRYSNMINWVHLSGDTLPKEARRDRLFPVALVGDQRFGNKDFLSVNEMGQRPKGQLSMVGYYRQCAMDHQQIVNQNLKEIDVTIEGPKRIVKGAELHKYMCDYWDGRNTAAEVGLQLGWIAELQNPTDSERSQLRGDVIKEFARNRAALVEAEHAPEDINSELKTIMSKAMRVGGHFNTKNEALKMALQHARMEARVRHSKHCKEVDNALLVTLPGFKESLYPDMAWNDYARSIWEPAVYNLFQKNMNGMFPSCWNYVVKNHPMFMKPSLRWVLPVIFLSGPKSWDKFVAATKNGMTYLDWPRWALHHYDIEDGYRNQLSAAERNSLNSMLYEEGGDDLQFSKRLIRSRQVNGISGFLNVDWEEKRGKLIVQAGHEHMMKSEIPAEANFYPRGDSEDDLLNAKNAERVLKYTAGDWSNSSNYPGRSSRRKSQRRALPDSDSDNESDAQPSSSTTRRSSTRRSSKRLRSLIPQSDFESDPEFELSS